MSASPSFSPRWASPPGETIRDALEERGLSGSAFANAIGLEHSRLPALLSGQEVISIALARRLTSVIGGSVEFWLTRDGQYRDDLAIVEAEDWARSLPTAQMAQFGWIEKTSDWRDHISSCLRFFAVHDVAEWQETYGSLVDHARFRVSEKATFDPNSAVAWLRRAEVEAESRTYAQWDLDSFIEALDDIRPLTRVSDPRRFIPELIQTCANVGLALVVLRAPTRCPASGAARFLDSGTPLIVLSARYLADDHFWFSFGHEAGHIALHGEQNVYVDELARSADRPEAREEREADKFSADWLVAPAIRDELLHSRPTPARLHHLANEANVSSGILVGQLQYAGILAFGSVLNRLKRRYRWDGPTLEKA